MNNNTIIVNIIYIIIINTINTIFYTNKLHTIFIAIIYTLILYQYSIFQTKHTLFNAIIKHLTIQWNIHTSIFILLIILIFKVTFS